LQPGQRIELYLPAYFHPGHVTQIKNQLDASTGLIREVTVQGKAYFEYRVGWIRKDVLLRHLNIPPMGLPKST